MLALLITGCSGAVLGRRGAPISSPGGLAHSLLGDTRLADFYWTNPQDLPSWVVLRLGSGNWEAIKLALGTPICIIPPA